MNRDDMNDIATDAETEMLREGGAVAIKTAAIIVPIEAVVVFFGVFAARSPLQASSALFHGGGHYWYEAGMPGVLFSLVGGALACFLGWRMTASSGLTGPAELQRGRPCEP